MISSNFFVVNVRIHKREQIDLQWLTLTKHTFSKEMHDILCFQLEWLSWLIS